MWRAGAVLFSYCCFPEKGRSHPRTLNILNCHPVIFCRRASYCTSYESKGRNLSYEPNYLDILDETMLFSNQIYIQPTCAPEVPLLQAEYFRGHGRHH